MALHHPQPDSQKTHRDALYRDLSEKLGIENSEVFFKTPEGKKLISEIVAMEEMKEEREKELAFEAIQEKLHHVSASRPHKTFAEQQQEMSEAAAILKELLEEPEHKHEDKSLAKELADIYDEFQITELEEVQESLEQELESYASEESGLTAAEADLDNEEEYVRELFERPSPRPSNSPEAPEAEEDLDAEYEIDFQAQLNAYKEQLIKELAAIPQALAQSGGELQSDQPKPAPTPKPQGKGHHAQGQGQARQQQVQSVRAHFCRGMIEAINKHAEHGDQPTAGRAAVRGEYQNPENDPTGVKHRMKDHFKACKSDVAQRRDQIQLKKKTAEGKVQKVGELLHVKKVAETYDLKREKVKAATHEPGATPSHDNKSTPTPGRR
jgi:hypothetical protein